MRARRKLEKCAKGTDTTKRLLANARELAEELARETAAAGITQQELERNARKALAYVKKRRRNGCY